MRRFIVQVISGILGFYLASKIVRGVAFSGSFFLSFKTWPSADRFLETLVFVGLIWGILNFFVKPILKLIAFPIRIITLNLFSLVIAMGLVWVVDIVSPELVIAGIVPLFLTTLILWGISSFLNWWLPSK